MLWSTEALLSQSVINLNVPETVCLRHMLAADSCPGHTLDCKDTFYCPTTDRWLSRKITNRKPLIYQLRAAAVNFYQPSLSMTHTESFKLSVIFSSTDTTRGSSEQSAVWCKNVQKEDKRLAWSPEEQHVHVTGYKLYLKCLIMKINERISCLWSTAVIRLCVQPACGPTGSLNDLMVPAISVH